MELPLYRAVLRAIYNDAGNIVGYDFKYKADTVTILQECALTRAYAQALASGALSDGDLSQVQFQDEQGNKVQTTDLARSAVDEFFATFPDLYPFGASQHMSEVGKVLTARKPPLEMLEKLFSPAFAARMDTHKALKLLQIMCQPGRLLGKARAPGSASADIPPLGTYDVRAYIDIKRPEEDGPIYVHPDTWDSIILPAYSTETHPLIGCTLIKVNSSTSSLTIKGVLKRATPREWENIVARSGRDDFDVLLCGNAIKDNDGYIEGEVYDLNESSFAHHSDSIVERGHRVNIPGQVMTRSGMDNHQFTRLAAGPALKRLAGLMQFDEEEVLAAIGAFSKDGKETTLESAAAIKKRIMEHHLPPNHPVNATQIYRLAMTVIKDHLAKIEIPGFHGMGAPSNNQRGYVGVPTFVYRNWLKEHHSNSAYLFRMPYLGSYCGMFVTLIPMQTDTILVNWQDALQMEGDFDGDQYYVVPSLYISNPEAAKKPVRAAKGAKAILPLTPDNLRAEIITLASNKMGIGPRDSKLSMAFDYYNEAKAIGNQTDIAYWQGVIEQLQIWVQQAVEGLKHGHQNQLTNQDVRALFPQEEPQHHIYTQLFAKSAFKKYQLQSTRMTPGYIDKVRMAVAPEHAWHPLHELMVRISQLEFGEILDITPYYEAIKTQPENGWHLTRTARKELWAGIRGLQRKYARGVQKWDGGKNKNVNFGEDVLLPIRQDWARLMEAMQGSERATYEVHVMLANVAYEPQPNWKLYGDGSGYWPEGVFHRINRLGKARMKRRTEGKLVYHKLVDQKPILDGQITVEVNKRTFRYRKFLPRPGSLFHHLSEPAMARLILKDVLPSIEAEDLLRELILAATRA